MNGLEEPGRNISIFACQWDWIVCRVQYLHGGDLFSLERRDLRANARQRLDGELEALGLFVLFRLHGAHLSAGAWRDIIREGCRCVLFVTTWNGQGDGAREIESLVTEREPRSQRKPHSK